MSEIDAEEHETRRPDRALLLLLLLLVLVIAAFIGVRPWRRSQVAWNSNLATSLKAAGRTGHPVFVELYADWCEPCRKMDRETFSDSEVGAALAPLSPVRLNDDQPEVREDAKKWNVVGLPTHLLLNPNGQVRARVVGYLSSTQLLSWLKSEITAS